MPKGIKQVIAALMCLFFMLSNYPATAADTKETNDNTELVRLSAKEVDALEATAEAARGDFYAKNYEQAVSKLESLTEQFNVSQPLYLCEFGMALMALGKHDQAQIIFRKAYNLLEGFIDVKSEKSAASYWGQESEKVYRGDPYERAFLCLILGLNFLNENDVDNALACFKNGILNDSDVGQELYRSDFGLLYFFEAKCFSLRDQPEMAQASMALAINSFKMTHPIIRPLVYQKQSLLYQLEDQEKNKKDSGSCQQQIDALDEQINAAINDIDLEYVRPLLDDFNTLILLWSGFAPNKQRYGQYGEQRAIVKKPNLENRYEMCMDGVWHDGIKGFADISFQATTRGGRLMDDVLSSQADFKAFSSNFGDALLDSADDVGGYAGLALLAVGLISKGIAAATKVEADIRTWQLLPDSLHMLPLALPPGEHEIEIDSYDMIYKTGYRTVKFSVDDQRPLNISIIFPMNCNQDKNNTVPVPENGEITEASAT